MIMKVKNNVSPVFINLLSHVLRVDSDICIPVAFRLVLNHKLMKCVEDKDEPILLKPDGSDILTYGDVLRLLKVSELNLVLERDANGKPKIIPIEINGMELIPYSFSLSKTDKFFIPSGSDQNITVTSNETPINGIIDDVDMTILFCPRRYAQEFKKRNPRFTKIVDEGKETSYLNSGIILEPTAKLTFEKVDEEVTNITIVPNKHLEDAVKQDIRRFIEPLNSLVD